MTNERQAELRGKLYSMLGDRGQVAAATSSSSTGVRKEGTDRDSVSSEDQRIIATSNSVNTNSTESNGTADSLIWKEKTPLAVAERVSSGTGGERMQSPVGSLAVDKGTGVGQCTGEEWVCSACSLINSSLCRRCLTCDALKCN